VARRWARASIPLAGLVVLAATTWTCAPDLPPQHLVDKFRVIAIKATPASGVGGTQVEMEAVLSETSSGLDPLLVWAACIPLPGQTGRQCLESVGSEDDAAQWVFLGITPTVRFTLPEVDAEQGVSKVYVNFLACDGLPPEDIGDDPDLFDFCAPVPETGATGESLLVYKTVQAVAEAGAGNGNPLIEDVRISGSSWGEDETPQVTCPAGEKCETVRIAVLPEAGSAETYTEIRFDEEVEFTEQLYVSWFTTAGRMGGDRTGVDEETGAVTVDWKPLADDAAGTVQMWFVLYDGRGGNDWVERTLEVVRP